MTKEIIRIINKREGEWRRMGHCIRNEEGLERWKKKKNDKNRRRKMKKNGTLHKKWGRIREMKKKKKMIKIEEGKWRRVKFAIGWGLPIYLFLNLPSSPPYTQPPPISLQPPTPHTLLHLGLLLWQSIAWGAGALKIQR